MQRTHCLFVILVQPALISNIGSAQPIIPSPPLPIIPMARNSTDQQPIVLVEPSISHPAATETNIAPPSNESFENTPVTPIPSVEEAPSIESSSLATEAANVDLVHMLNFDECAHSSETATQGEEMPAKLSVDTMPITF